MWAYNYQHRPFTIPLALATKHQRLLGRRFAHYLKWQPVPVQVSAPTTGVRHAPTFVVCAQQIHHLAMVTTGKARARVLGAKSIKLSGKSTPGRVTADNLHWGESEIGLCRRCSSQASRTSELALLQNKFQRNSAKRQCNVGSRSVTSDDCQRSQVKCRSTLATRLPTAVASSVGGV